MRSNFLIEMESPISADRNDVRSEGFQHDVHERRVGEKSTNRKLHTSTAIHKPPTGKGDRIHRKLAWRIRSDDDPLESDHAQSEQDHQDVVELNCTPWLAKIRFLWNEVCEVVRQKHSHEN